MFPAQRSCRYNCGSNLGSCSCSSSCQRYGNCCYDYSSKLFSSVIDCAPSQSCQRQWVTVCAFSTYNVTNNNSWSPVLQCKVHLRICLSSVDYCASTTPDAATTGIFAAATSITHIFCIYLRHIQKKHFYPNQCFCLVVGIVY